jgi:cell division protein FtsQ
LVGLAAWALFGSSWLAAQEVTVSGERTLSAAEIRSAANVDLGTPLVRLDLDGIQQRVAALRPVASVTVHRAWPHTVAIRVTERRPVATVRVGSGWALVDKTGVVFRHSDAQPKLPLLLLASPHDRAVLRATASVVHALPADLLGRMRLLQARSMDSITLHLKGGDLVHWGGPEHSADKAAVLRVLLKQPASVYDVSVPAQPTTAG